MNNKEKKKFIKCPKCHYISGDDWEQCKKKCPMIMSPYYLEDIATLYKPNVRES